MILQKQSSWPRQGDTGYTWLHNDDNTWLLFMTLLGMGAHSSCAHRICVLFIFGLWLIYQYRHICALTPSLSMGMSYVVTWKYHALYNKVKLPSHSCSLDVLFAMNLYCKLFKTCYTITKTKCNLVCFLYLLT